MLKPGIAALLVAAPAAAWAQDAQTSGEIMISDPIAESSITVLASGERERLDGTGESVSVFDRAEIDRVQGADLTRLLVRAPGMSFERSGGPGAITGLHVRGAESDQLLVLIDGVRMADPGAPGGGFDPGNLLMGNLAKVELQRSSNSTIWGGQALGGVMAVTTGAEPGLSGTLEYGAYDTLYGTAAAGLRLGSVRLDVEAGHYGSRGFSAASGGSEPDGFHQSELAGGASADLGGGLSAFARGRYARGHLDTDGFPAPSFTLADTDEYQDTRQISGVGGLRYSGEGLELTVDWSAAETRRANFDPSLGTAPTYTTDGLSQRGELRGRWTLRPGLALDFGGEREWTRFSSLFDPRHATAIAGAYAQLDYDHGPLHVAAGLRRDEHRDFGGHWSAGADAAFALSDQWRLTASYGEGFKAPTLFQLDSDFGNAGLRPETSRSFDTGIAFGGARLTLFRRDTRDMIGFVSCFGVATGICANRPSGTYDNIGRTRAQGVELEDSAHLTPTLSLTGAYTYLEALDRTAGSSTEGNDLARRPRNMLSASADWSRGYVRLGADVRVVSHSFDDAANAVRLRGYALVTLRAEWQATDAVTLYGRLENLGDERYQTAAGYASPGRGAYIGARARL